MIAVYGMNKRVGNVSFYGMSQDQFNKPYSDDTATLIDDEVRKLVEEQYARAQQLLTDHIDDLHTLAKELLSKEVLVKSDLERLIGPRPWPEQSPLLEMEEEEAKQESKAETFDELKGNDAENAEITTEASDEMHTNGEIADSEEVAAS